MFHSHLFNMKYSVCAHTSYLLLSSPGPLISFLVVSELLVFSLVADS